MNRTSCPPNAYCLREEFISQRLMCYVVVTKKKSPDLSGLQQRFILIHAHIICSSPGVFASFQDSG